MCRASPATCACASLPACCAPGTTAATAAKTWHAARPALQRGRRLRPADIGLIASLGIDTVMVYRPLRVALFSTGDELRTLGQTLDPGSVYDSNRYSLMAALQRLPVEVVDLGLVADDPGALRTLARWRRRFRKPTSC